MVKKTFKLLLLTFKDAPIKIDGLCPKCKAPLSVKETPFGRFIVCKNPSCEYYSKLPTMK